jgi:hypothetical protein
MKREFNTPANMLYFYEIVERTPERHFEGNHYAIVQSSKMNITKNGSGHNLVSVIHKAFKTITFIMNDHDQLLVILDYFITSSWCVYWVGCPSPITTLSSTSF